MTYRSTPPVGKRKKGQGPPTRKKRTQLQAQQRRKQKVQEPE